ncbi:MAG: FAD-dependent oxidoreductase, partial [Clostridia bacterium]
GDANSALQYALLLSNYCKRVTVCTLFDSFFGDKLLVDRLLERENVTVYHNLSLHEFCTNNGELSGLRFINTADGNDFNLDVKAVFIAIGQIPNNEVFRSLAELDSNGYIISDERCSTKTEGLFVAGDARTKSVRQLTTAVGDGAVSAVSACRYLDR